MAETGTTIPTNETGTTIPTNETGTNGTTSLVLFTSDTDRWLTFAYFLIVLPVALIANTWAVVLFAIRSQYKRPVHIILVTLCFMDVTIVLATLPWKLFVTFYNTIDVLDYAPCNVNIGCSMVGQLACYHVLTLLAVERYYYFCRPYDYEKYFTVRRTVICIMLIMLLEIMTMILVLTLEDAPSIGSPATLGCHRRSLTLTAAAFFFILYPLPEVICMVFCSVKIYKTCLNKVCRIPGTMAQVRRASPPMSNWKVKTSVKLILMLSGLFLVTSMPAGLVNTNGHVSSDILYDQFDASDPKTQFIRIANNVIHTVSPSIDPCIYLYLHRCLYKQNSINVE